MATEPEPGEDQPLPSWQLLITHDPMDSVRRAEGCAWLGLGMGLIVIALVLILSHLSY